MTCNLVPPCIAKKAALHDCCPLSITDVLSHYRRQMVCAKLALSPSLSHFQKRALVLSCKGGGVDERQMLSTLLCFHVTGIISNAQTSVLWNLVCACCCSKTVFVTVCVWIHSCATVKVGVPAKPNPARADWDG